ncbi:MAG: AraC family transcriptional regulator [Alphaproteobacteria bacterium]|nr:AraC family transcriptional regulator [Alphaproteobacteria bacterium]MBU0876111.1 AraC family transcriptional regulator [Alphaproteobacteria bacterium]MBU1771002.1 AraC family transcriptional regulator [Alphaproteobacteria bacterium]
MFIAWHLMSIMAQNTSVAPINRSWNSGFALYQAATYVGTPHRPVIVAATTNSHSDIQVFDWLVPERFEVISGGNSDDRAAKFCFYIANRATWIGRGNGQVQEVPAHKLVVINTNDPIRTISLGDTRHLTLVLPHWMVARHVLEPAYLSEATAVLPDENGLAARDIMFALRSCIGLEQFHSVSTKLVDGFLDALRPAKAGEHDPSLPKRSADVWRVREIIARNFRDPDFSAADIAHALGISIRYLHVICRVEDSPGRMIRKFRLQQAEALLKAPAWQNRSITDIAFECGFNSSSQFSTSFRSFAGVSPRQLRYSGPV